MSADEALPQLRQPQDRLLQGSSLRHRAATTKEEMGARMRRQSRVGDWRLAPPRDTLRRPRLAFFRPDRTDLPAFVQQHFDEHVRCLEFFFDVVIIEENSQTTTRSVIGYKSTSRSSSPGSTCAAIAVSRIPTGTLQSRRLGS